MSQIYPAPSESNRTPDRLENDSGLTTLTYYIASLKCHCCFYHIVAAAASSNSNFTFSSPVCPGNEVNFMCTVVDPGVPFRGSTIWRIGTNSRCGLAHSLAPIQQQSCSGTQFSATLAAPEGGCYTSTISATVDHADSGLPVLCYGFEETPSRLVGNASVEVIGQYASDFSAIVLVLPLL